MKEKHGCISIKKDNEKDKKRSNAKASLQELNGKAYIIRLHPNGGGYGDPWIWSAVCERDGDTAIIHAAIDSPIEFDEIRRVLLESGFTKVKWYRIKNGIKIVSGKL